MIRVRGRRLISTFAVLALMAVVAASGGCQGKASPASPQDRAGTLGVVAGDVSQGVGEVRKTGAGSRGAPIVVLEENHASRAGQIELAIMLVRLFERHGLSDVALEGFIMGQPPLDATWFAGPESRFEPSAREAVAVRLLREGEIGAVEFLKLIRSDVVVHPVEKEHEYRVAVDGFSSGVPVVYLVRIAGCSLSEKQVLTAERLSEEFTELVSAGDKAGAGLKQQEFFDFVLSADPWARGEAQRWLDPKVAMSSSEQQVVAAAEEIVSRARELSVEIPASEKRAMEEYLRFMRMRLGASKTMVTRAGEIADEPGTKLVAMNVGAAHTEGICAALRDSGREFAALRPASLETDFDTASWGAWQRKYERKSLYSEGLSKFLTEALGTAAHKKFEATIGEPWLQAKAEVYLLTQLITTRLLGGSAVPGGGNPPYGLDPLELRGNWASVDAMAIRVVPDKKGSPERAVVFPVDLRRRGSETAVRLWVKAGLGTADVSRAERESVEAMLLRARDEVKKEKTLPSKAEDSLGRVQVTINTIAAFGQTSEAVSNVVLGAV